MIEALHSMGMSSQMISSSVITIIITIVVIAAGRHMEMIPKGLQNFVEICVESLHNFFIGVMGEHSGKKFFPLIATLFIYILISNYTGLLPMSGHIPGLAAPTSSINFPIGMAIIVFITIEYAGIWGNHGLKYYKHLFKPFAFLFPILVLEVFIHPVSLSLRLYGNIHGEETVVEQFFELLPLGLPIIMLALGVLFCLIQALVFSLLSAIYISEAAEPVDGEPLEHHA